MGNSRALFCHHILLLDLLNVLPKGYGHEEQPHLFGPTVRLVRHERLLINALKILYRWTWFTWFWGSACLIDILKHCKIWIHYILNDQHFFLVEQLFLFRHKSVVQTWAADALIRQDDFVLDALVENYVAVHQSFKLT